MEYDMDLLGEVKEMYDLVNKLFIVCIKKKIKLVFENPFSEEHFLRRYWCLLPKIIDTDRRENGDYYKKPTQYWFINIKPLYNFIFEPIDYVPQKVITRAKASENTSIKTERSMIHPQYANRFIRQYLIPEKGGEK